MIIEHVHDEQSAKLLAKANLLRIRMQWDEAVTCCMQVLYHSPDNWSAHALLGDIYADQNRPEEAIQWYCMTLDIRPDAQSVREKLSKVVNSRRHQIVQSMDPTRPYINRDGRTFQGGRMGKLAWYWSAPERKRRVAVGAVILGFLAVILVPSLVLTHSNHGAAAAVFTDGPAPTNTTLLLQPVPPASKTIDPIAPAPMVTPLNSPTNQPVLDPPATAESQHLAPTLRDPNDEAITEALQADTTLHAQGIQVTDAQMDPGTTTLTVTFVSTGPPSPTVQDRQMRDALYVARTALQVQPAASANSCIVRCLAQPPPLPQTYDAVQASPSGPQPDALTFIGTVSRDSVSSQGADLSGLSQTQLPGFFTDVWWQTGPAPTS